MCLNRSDKKNMWVAWKPDFLINSLLFFILLQSFCFMSFLNVKILLAVTSASLLQWRFSKGSSEHGPSPNWLFFLHSEVTLLRVNVLCWLHFLTKWGVGPFKRGSHLSVHWQQSWSGEPHASLITKKVDEIQCIMVLIWSRWGCGLSTVNCRPYRFYIQRISTLHKCDKCVILFSYRRAQA